MKEILTDLSAGSVRVTGKLAWRHAWFTGERDCYKQYQPWDQCVDLHDVAIICRRGVTWGPDGGAANPQPYYMVPVTEELLDFLEEGGFYNNEGILVKSLVEKGLAFRLGGTWVGLAAVIEAAEFFCSPEGRKPGSGAMKSLKEAIAKLG